MISCTNCGGKAHNAYLCRRCEHGLLAQLRELPWLLQRLTETAVGQTRMSDNGGRRSARRADLDGEKPLAACIERFPDEAEEDLDRARRQRAKAALAHALAAGGINARASELLAEVDGGLGYWIRVLCEARGLDVPMLGPGRTVGVLRARWLAANVRAVVASPDAGEIVTDVHNWVGSEDEPGEIVRAINRPVPVRDLGRCPTWRENGPTDIHAHQCLKPLRAPADALEVHCRRCGVTHNVNRLLLGLMDELAHQHYTIPELLAAMRRVPEEYRVSERTLQRWRKADKLVPSGWRRGGPDGRSVITWHSDDDVPEYSWADIQKLKAADRRGAGVGSAS